MPLGRSRMMRKRRLPRNKLFRRKRVMRRAPPRVHFFKRTFRVADAIASYNAATGVATPISNGISVNLAQCPNSSEFTSLYDQYMIKGVRLSFQPLLTEGIASAISGSTNIWGFPKMSTVIDYDDVTPPGTEDVLLQYGTLKQTPAFKEHVRYWKTKVRIGALDTGAVVTANTVKGGQWIDTTYPNVPHYGLKVFNPGPIASGTPLQSASIAYSIYATLYIACKNVR